MDRSDVSELVDDPATEPELTESQAWRDLERTLLDRWLREDRPAD